MGAYKPGSEESYCVDNQMRDFAVRNSGKMNEFGIKADYTPQKTWNLEAIPCDKYYPEKCPKELPVCMRGKVNKVNTDSSNYKAINAMTGGKTLFAGNTYELCIAREDWKVM